jgi:NAD(P)-dependent dehydrogenase (short-subunit alcohol dehydrogenase family)
MKPLQGQVAVVAGATRGAGRGIACMLGEAGATVYCTGRSVRGRPPADGPYAGRPETIEETAELVDRFGGRGIAVRVDHTREDEVRDLVARVRAEQGRLDVLVNDIYGTPVTEWKPFWELSVDYGFLMQRSAVYTHIITARHAAPLMLERKRGLIVEVTEGDFFGYRSQLFHDLAVVSHLRLAYAMATELRQHGVAALAVTPGYMRTEAVLDHLGVTEQNWREGAKKDPHFLASETPFYVGRAVAALAADPEVMKKSGRVFASWDLAREYGFTDVDGRQPHWDEHMRGTNFPNYDRLRKCDTAFYEYWAGLFDVG